MLARKTSKGYFYAGSKRISKAEYKRRKKISKSLRAFHEKKTKFIESVKRANIKAPLVRTKEGLALLVREAEISRNRFLRNAVEKLSQVPKKYRELAKQIGVRKKRWVWYYDNVQKTAVDGKTALRMRHEFLLERMGGRLAGLSYEKAGKILLSQIKDKSLLARFEKRGHLTQREAEKLAERLLKQARKEKRLRTRLEQLEVLT